MTGSHDEAYDQLLAVAGPVSRETFEKLKLFDSEFRRWNSSINLVAPSTLSILWSRHILDSAQLRAFAPDARNWLDLGSGGGFPGAVMAILLAENPQSHIDLVESNNKKAAFLRRIISQSGARGHVHAVRIEEAPDRVARPDIVTARALAPLPRLLNLASPWLLAGATGLFHKGRDYLSEVNESRDAWDFDLVQSESKIDPASSILAISNLSRR